MPRDRIAGPVTIATLAALTILAPACGGASASSLFGSGNGSDDGGSHSDDAAPPPVVDASVPVIDSGPPHLPDGAPPPVGDGSATSDAFAPDANVPDAGPWSPVCPIALPATGTPCTGQDLQCEYGDAWWSVGCDTVVQCQNGQWGPYQPGGGCTGKPGPNPASCPASYGSVPVGNSCPSAGLSCLYDQGICSCELPFGPPPPPGSNGYWTCLPEQGCPFPRPRLGSACPTDGTSCTYEACSDVQNCTGGVWQTQPIACVGGTQGGTH